MAFSAFVVWAVIWNIHERQRQRRLAETRPPLDSAGFTKQLLKAGLEQSVAQFIWDEFQPYYFAPLTPHPEDRPISEMRIDPDDLSDIVVRFEKRLGRRWCGEWQGSSDPTLIEFAQGLIDSTRAA